MAIDTGSCVHLITQKDWIVDFQPIDSTTAKTLYYGVGDTLETNPIAVKGEGKIYIKVKKRIMAPTNVLFAPGIKESVLSADKLAEEVDISLGNNYTQMVLKDRIKNTTKDRNTIWISASKIVETSPKKVKKAYKGNNKIKSVRVVKLTITDLEAHLRLNHIPLEVIRQSIDHGILEDAEELEIPNTKHKLWCPICTSGKMARHYHYVGSMNHYNMQKTPGSSWSLHTFGPVPGIPTSCPKYMLVMVDNVSRFMIVSTHMNKDADTIIRQIEKNVRQIHTQFGREVQELLTDRGTEFCNEHMKTLEFKFGFVHRKASPRDRCEPAERAIQTIETDIRTLLLQSGVSIKYWSYAAQSSVYTRNCTYNKKIKDAAVSIVSKYPVKVVLRSFLPFRCPATVWQQTTNKLSSNGLAAVTLCKDIESFGYFFYLPSKRQVISTTNYKIPDFLTNPYLKSEEPNIMGKFTEALTRKVGDISEILGNEREIVEAFKDRSKTLNEHDIEEFNEELNDDDKRVQDDILTDIERDFTATDRVNDAETENLVDNVPEDIEKLERTKRTQWMEVQTKI